MGKTENVRIDVSKQLDVSSLGDGGRVERESATTFRRRQAARGIDKSSRSRVCPGVRKKELSESTMVRMVSFIQSYNNNIGS